MKDCIFCKIIRNEIPSYTIYEDNVVKAFLDISQATPGHTLVIPKKHVPNIYEYDAKFASDVFSRIPKIARAIKKSNPKIKGMNIINNNGKIASQSVFHSHFHLIPRYSDHDGFSMKFVDNSKKYSKDDFKKLQQKISSQLEDK
ncbi:histidine triad protein [Philodulcilactobacillus myokoensis]|uniref:Histidine triad protein n=1 Tax=Philodulcilactobacillus myokoensis TaxID=2929573 RepID=A0A9W6B0X1_9LACO|nr:HIT family protein [Philodulcilactobacillus myokoensis]GLB46736.1 histidine triad protein [Philodulcilactobacillus myokoensis]